MANVSTTHIARYSKVVLELSNGSEICGIVTRRTRNELVLWTGGSFKRFIKRSDVVAISFYDEGK